MVGGLLIEEGRLRARLTRAELAGRLGVPEERVASWETGAAAPSFDQVLAALAAAGWALRYGLEPYDAGEIGQIDRRLVLSPEGRLERLEAMLALERDLHAARLVGPLEE